MSGGRKRNRFRDGNNLDNRVKSGSIVENMLEIHWRREKGGKGSSKQLVISG